MSGNHDFHSLGTHLCRIEGDTLIIQLRGIITGDDMRQMLDHQMAIRREHGALFALFNAHASTGMSSEARRIVVEWKQMDAKPDAAAVYGASFTASIMLNMLIKAVEALGKAMVPTKLCSTEAEARAYLDEHRQVSEAKQSVSRS